MEPTIIDWEKLIPPVDPADIPWFHQETTLHQPPSLTKPSIKLGPLLSSPQSKGRGTSTLGRNRRSGSSSWRRLSLTSQAGR